MGFLANHFWLRRQRDRVNSAGLVSKRLYRTGLGEPARLRSRIREAKPLFYTRFGWFVLAGAKANKRRQLSGAKRVE